MSDPKTIARRGADASGSISARMWIEREGSAAIELALIAPAVLMVLSLVILAGEGFQISRKVTQTANTLTDLATRQANVGASSSTYTYSAILDAASLVIAPFDAAKLSMVLSEIQTNGTTAGTVVWSEANANGAPLAPGASVTVPTALSGRGYVILGAVTYTYSPLNIYLAANAIALNESIYLAPRNSAGVACCK